VSDSKTSRTHAPTHTHTNTHLHSYTHIHPQPNAHELASTIHLQVLSLFHACGLCIRCIRTLCAPTCVRMSFMTETGRCCRHVSDDCKSCRQRARSSNLAVVLGRMTRLCSIAITYKRKHKLVSTTPHKPMPSHGHKHMLNTHTLDF